MPKAARREAEVGYVTTTTEPSVQPVEISQTNGSGENPTPSDPMEQAQSGFLPSRVPDAAIQYVLEGYRFIDDKSLVIRGNIVALSAEWIIKRGEYSSETIRAYAQVQFGQNSAEPFKCDFVVREPRIKIIEAEGDTAIVREVYQQFARLLDLATSNLMVEHLQTIYLDMPPATATGNPPKKPKGVDAGNHGPGQTKDARKEGVREEEL
jgi:hypothetical protein